MLAWVGVTMTMLVSPTEVPVARPVAPQVLSSTLVVASRPERTAEARLGTWVSTLAVVRKGEPTHAPSSLQLFVAVAPLGRAAGLWVIGSF
jgi:hypothetical protein